MNSPALGGQGPILSLLATVLLCAHVNGSPDFPTASILETEI